jgi:hypothetical protein
MAYPRLRELTLIFLVLTLAASSSGAARADKLIVVVADRISLSDLDNKSFPTISKMLRHGAVGLISPNCVGSKSQMSVLLTAGAGSSCRGDDYVREVYDSREFVKNDQMAENAHRTRIGLRVGADSALFLGIAQAKREAVGYGPVTIGLLGESLRRTGKKTGVVGNSDTLPNSIDRSAAVIAADNNGMIDIGRLSIDTLHNGINGSTRFFSDVALLADTTIACLARADFVVVDFGDTSRLEEYKLDLSEKAYSQHKAYVLKSLDSFLGRILVETRAQETVVVLVSFSPPVNGYWDRLTPIVIYPSAQSGLLTSATTRTDGAIAASDFAPTMLRLLNVRPLVPIAGREARTVTKDQKLSRLNDIDTRVATNRKILVPTMWSMAGIAGLALTGSAVTVAFSLRPKRSVLLMLRIGLLICASACLAMLLAVFAPAGPVSYMASWAGGTVVLIGLSSAVESVRRNRADKAGVQAVSVVTLYWLTIAAIIIDGATGGQLCRFALPSSSYISGLRYYGVGNEYAAALIFMSGLAVLYSAKTRGKLVPLIGFLIVIVMGMGTMGANYGGMFTGVVTFVLIWVVVRRGVFDVKHLIGAFSIGVVLVSLFALIDLKIAGESVSHAGRIAQTAYTLGGTGVTEIALRKMLYNIRLTFGTDALKLYVAFTPLLVLWFWRIQPKVRDMFKEDPIMLPGLKALWVGAAAAFLANDSGVVMVCVMMAMTTIILLYSLLDRLQSSSVKS